MVVVRQVGWPSLIATSRTPESWPRPTRRWFRDHVRTHFVVGKPAGTDGSQPKAARVGLGLVALVILTSSAVASVSVWWVPAYLALMVLIFVTPQRHRQPVQGRKPSEISANLEASDFAEELAIDRMAEGEQIPIAVRWPSVLSADESSPESVNSRTDTTGTGGMKPRRSRSRVRKVAKSTTDPVPEFTPATWIQVRPGKFVRADTLVHTIGKAKTGDPSADPPPFTDEFAEVTAALTAPAVVQQQQLPLEPLELTPTDEGTAFALEDIVQRPVAEEYGITPSTFGPPPVSSSAQGLEDDTSSIIVEPSGDPTLVVDLNAEASGSITDLGSGGLRGQAFRNHVCRVSRGLSTSTMLDMDRVSSRRNVRERPRLRAHVGSSFAPNTRLRQAVRRAFGRLPHIQCALRPRSPPYC